MNVSGPMIAMYEKDHVLNSTDEWIAWL